MADNGGANIQNSGSHFYVQLADGCDISDVEAVVLQLYQDAAFIAQPRLLLDFSAATEIGNPQKVLQLAVTFYAKRTFNTPGKTALILADDRFQQLLQAFSALASPLPIELKSFNDKAAAEAWLTS